MVGGGGDAAGGAGGAKTAAGGGGAGGVAVAAGGGAGGGGAAGIAAEVPARWAWTTAWSLSARSGSAVSKICRVVMIGCVPPVGFEYESCPLNRGNHV